jgi:chromosome segregation protein
VFLRSLSLRGFKSFADTTVLDVEPGITVIVGPNGSGKSNVVDALAWVLGTHSAKKVRGGSMADVIFAGSPSRARSGQARVEIVIDNADGRLSGGVGTAASAGEFSEIRIARVIHHDGATVYEINGEEVRALDVQELLSDTGLGRELHTIVGQGQLDEILNARPEERRRYIEEAAGILKHRRRRERAIRKLEQVDGHIEKLRTVLRELRRQLRPLERQAEAADRHAALQADLREVRVRLAALDLHDLTARLEHEERGGDDVAADLAALEGRLAGEQARVGELEQQVGALGSAVDADQATTHALTSLAERVRGTADLVEARRRHLVEYVEEPLAGRPPAELRAHAERVDAEQNQRAEERDHERERLDEAVGARRAAESARREHEQAQQAERRRRAELRERVLRWEGEVSALRGAIATTEAELGRVASTLSGLDARHEEAAREGGEVEEEIQQLDTREVELTGALEQAEAVVVELDASLERLRERARDLDAERASQSARAEALRAALAEADAGTTALLGNAFEGVLGRVADHVRVDPDGSTALAAALGQVGEAVVVTTTDRARRAVAWLRGASAGRAVVVAANASTAPVELDDDARSRLETAGARPLSSMVEPADDSEASAQVVRALSRWLTHAWLVADWDTAVLLHGRDPRGTFVTPDGDVAGPDGYRAGGSPERSAVLTAAAAEVAEARAAELTRELGTVVAERDHLAERLQSARARLDAATDRINESDARITGAAERLARLHKEMDSLATQRAVAAAQRDELQQVLDRDREALTALQGRGPESGEEPEAEPEGVDEAAQALDDEVERAREVELEARVRLERTTEQVRHLELQAAALRREADEVEAALAEAARRRELRRHGIDRCGELAVVVRAVIEALERALDEARRTHAERADALGGCREELATARERAQQVATERDALRERRHATDLRRAELTSRLDNLVTRLRNDLSLTPDDVRAEIPDPPPEPRESLSEREDVLVRRIGMLGRVNPLALEEYRALEERHAFLSDQLDDLRRSRKDLEEVITAVDERIREVFRVAFDDVAREFESPSRPCSPVGTADSCSPTPTTCCTPASTWKPDLPASGSPGCPCSRVASDP